MYTSVDKFYFLFYILNVYISYLETSFRKKEASAQNIWDIFSLQSKRAKDTLLIGEPQMLPLQFSFRSITYTMKRLHR